MMKHNVTVAYLIPWYHSLKHKPTNNFIKFQFQIFNKCHFQQDTCPFNENTCAVVTYDQTSCLYCIWNKFQGTFYPKKPQSLEKTRIEPPSWISLDRHSPQKQNPLQPLSKVLTVNFIWRFMSNMTNLTNHY